MIDGVQSFSVKSDVYTVAYCGEGEALSSDCTYTTIVVLQRRPTVFDVFIYLFYYDKSYPRYTIHYNQHKWSKINVTRTVRVQNKLKLNDDGVLSFINVFFIFFLFHSVHLYVVTFTRTCTVHSLTCKRFYPLFAQTMILFILILAWCNLWLCLIVVK